MDSSDARGRFIFALRKREEEREEGESKRLTDYDQQPASKERQSVNPATDRQSWRRYNILKLDNLPLRHERQQRSRDCQTEYKCPTVRIGCILSFGEAIN